MGYESKVFVVGRYEVENRAGEKWIGATKLAEFDLCKMGCSYNKEFYDAFKREIDYTLYLPTFDESGNEIVDAVNEDSYGEHMKAADLQDLIDALKICEQRDHYRRIPPLVAMLEALVAEQDEWETDCDCLEAVHYGY